MDLYHGSKIVVGKPVHGKGKLHNDYGKGFYCTENKELAKEWAVNEFENGYVNCYLLDTDGLNILDLNDENYTAMHWLSVLLQNRIFDITTPLEREAKKYIISNYAVPVDKADVITGYRADDSYFSYARDFISGTISYEQLSKALLLGNLGRQICIKSEKAFDAIKPSGSELVLANEWYPKKKLRDQNARSGYREMAKEDYRRGELYIARIIDEEVTADDLRLRQSISE